EFADRLSLGRWAQATRAPPHRAKKLVCVPVLGSGHRFRGTEDRMRQYTPVIVALVVVNILILLKNPALRRKAVTDFSNGPAQAARSSSPNGGTGPRSSQRAASPTGPQDELKTASAYMERGGRNYSEKKLQAAVADYTKVIELTSNPNDKIAALCNRGK